MLVSFSRRLGYLHDSPQVQRRVDGWLRDDGILGELSAFDPEHVSMFRNIAPVAPEQALSTIERSVRNVADERIADICAPFRELLRSLAYESEYFDRCIEILVRMALGRADKSGRTEGRDEIAGLFTIYLSGTHASLAQRLIHVETLLRHPDERRQEIGVKALKAMLQTGEFVSFHNFEFGARSRDFGYMPRTNKEVLDWYKAVLDFCVKIDAQDIAASRQERTLGERVRAVQPKSAASDFWIEQLAEGLPTSFGRLRRNV